MHEDDIPADYEGEAVPFREVEKLTHAELSTLRLAVSVARVEGEIADSQPTRDLMEKLSRMQAATAA